MSSSNATVYRILFSISIVHLLNDSLQSVIPALLPILKNNLSLSYFHLGVILLVMNVTASVLQPFIGYFTDKAPRPLILPLAMLISGTGMVGIAMAEHYYTVLLAVALVGIGSAIFHPEASRVAHMASGPRRGLGQSIFQVGGNTGHSLAPVMTALIFAPLGQGGAYWFVIPAGIGLCVLMYVAYWYAGQQRAGKAKSGASGYSHRSRRLIALGLLVVIVSVRSWIYAAYQSFYPLFLIDVMGESLSHAQVYTFLFLLAGAIGTFFGGPIADRFGKRNLLIISLLGAFPFALLIPHVTGSLAYLLLFLDGLILLCSFSVTVVYAQELLPGRIGTVSGLMIGLAFGMGGIGASVLGRLADWQGLSFIMLLCALMHMVGLLGFLLPKDRTLADWEKETIVHEKSVTV
ncbi:MFS transporter [Brevibacillus sp. SYP-B805]|uniref:MFS transporter n=1 Tax=Brevibacillus sp. SYP-B805 TaxID=1578199 RepID=UPI0013EB0C7D|nr:MFS transporter [Brevibacillus sp. SYP-B805]NGQ95372.1 MFS transporter [Brevibacillus sp. SYP-B805]